jgi:deazaflavin-dependent oxidoreductase (nitroreductase family)
LKKTNPSSSSKASSRDREPYLYLTTRGRKSGRDREIEIWFTERNGCFYVIAEHQTSHWLQNLRADSAVRVRVGKRSFAARARVLSPGQADADLRREIQGLSQQKYGWGEGMVVELVPE